MQPESRRLRKASGEGSPDRSKWERQLGGIRCLNVLQIVPSPVVSRDERDGILGDRPERSGKGHVTHAIIQHLILRNFTCCETKRLDKETEINYSKRARCRDECNLRFVELDDAHAIAPLSCYR